MKIYVLETGIYSDRVVRGVYATEAAAMAAWTPEPGALMGSHYGDLAGQPWSYEWGPPDKYGERTFGADWDDAAVIKVFEMNEA